MSGALMQRLYHARFRPPQIAAELLSAPLEGFFS
jgi:hypothetical protein